MWNRVPTANAPVARCAHQTEYIGGRLYMFGGWSDTQMLNDLHILDPATMGWTSAYNEDVDLSFVMPRSGHSMNSVGKKLLVFGGSAVQDGSNVFMNDVLLFDIESNKWSLQNTHGQIPCGRSKHTSTLIDSKAYIVGGGDGLRLYDDVFSLDIETMQWIRPNVKGSPLSPCWGHSTVQVGSQLVVFGGHEGMNRVNDVHILDTVSMIWRREPCPGRTEGEVPRPRAGHTATVIGHHMFVWGGGDGRILPNTYGLDTRVWQWWMGGAAPPRCAHTATVVGDKLIGFGGGDGVACFNDVYALNVGDQLEALYQARPQVPTPTILQRPNTNTPPQTNEQNQHPAAAATAPTTANRPAARNNTNNKTSPVVQKAKDSNENPPTIPPKSPPNRRRNSKQHNNANSGDNNTNNNKDNTKRRSIDAKSALPQNAIASEINFDTSKQGISGIALWLESVGMRKYLDKFVAEEIDMDILDMVTEAHLKLLGIPLGDRLRICVAINSNKVGGGRG